MSLPGLSVGRAAARRLMTDRCVIRRRIGQTLDPTTNQYTPTWSEIYSGPCRLRFQSADTQSRDVADQQILAQQLTLSVPYPATASVRVDDVAEITSQDLTVRIAGLFVQTHATARRFPVEALS